jgi:sarcosine oxidase subunit alpha
MNRLDLPTVRIDPSRRFDFRFQNRPYQGVRGDTVATALFAGGVRIFGRSLKYHRPRGLYSLDGECSNTLVNIDGVPNVRAEQTPLRPNMGVRAQNVAGSVENDWMGFMDGLDWAMPAGFYYQSLHKPAPLWPVALKLVRRAAGLGTLDPELNVTGRFEEIYPTADVCVVGGGPAGMAAARAAAAHGLRVILFERRPWLGGFHEHRAAADDRGLPLYRRARRQAETIRDTGNIRVFTHTCVIGAYNDNLITAVQTGTTGQPFRERYIEVRAGRVVVATGCIERPLLFENNERPGIMQIGCAHRLARTYGVLPGGTAVFSVGHDLGLEAAADLHDLGLKIVCVADIRKDGQDPGRVEALAQRGIPLRRGWVAVAAQGRKEVRQVTLRGLQENTQIDIACDLLVASAGMTPLTGIITLLQGKLRFDPHTGFFLPMELPPGLHVAGRILGLHHPASLEASGRKAGFEAALGCGAAAGSDLRQAAEAAGSCPGPVRGTRFVLPEGRGRKTFICFDEDTTVKNVNQALAMGFDRPELIKRFTAAGTGPGQGGIPGHNLPLFVAQAHSADVHAVKPTTVRSPLTPVSLAGCAGRNHDMCKRTPLHDAQQSAGGRMQRVGAWKRVRYFSGDRSCRSEIENVRTNVGLLDASTLGKFKIWGPDALKALQRVYVGDMSRIAAGKIKYSAMCNDDGCLVDDGVALQIRDHEYYLTTSTGRAGQTVEWVRYHARYEDWDFHMVDLTDAVGVINLAGPHARAVLEQVTTADVSAAEFPFAAWREFKILDRIPVRALRLGFVGELSYELHTPSSYLQSLWDVLQAAGRKLGIAPFGLEAQNVLRMEKGHLIIGSESEQRTTLHDLGLGFLWARDKSDPKTVGAAALRHTAHQRGRLKLIGIEVDDGGRVPGDGSLVVDQKIRGYICIARFSTTLQKVVGMALVDEPLAGLGRRLDIFEAGGDHRRRAARVVAMPFYDPEGRRMRM